MDKPVILLADDDELLIKVLQRELEREGYDVLTCLDGERALDLTRHAAPDLILLDVMMPKRNGWEVCREIRAESDVPIIMLTARGEEMDKVMGLRLGSDDYVVKPFGLFELLARIEAMLRRANMSRNGQSKTRPTCEIQLGDMEIDTARRTRTSAKTGRRVLNTMPIIIAGSLVSNSPLITSPDSTAGKS